MLCASVAHLEGWVLLWLKWLSNPHMWFNTLPNRATQETLLFECLTCLKLWLGWGKNKVLAQGLKTLSLWSYQIVFLFAPSNLGHTLTFIFNIANKRAFIRSLIIISLIFFLWSFKHLFKGCCRPFAAGHPYNCTWSCTERRGSFCLWQNSR